MSLKKDFETHFHKGFTDPELWGEFRNAVWEGDTFKIRNTLLRSGSERKMVDPVIFNQECKDKDLLEDYPEPLEMGDHRFKAQDKFIYKLSQMRDIPFGSQDLSELPLYLRKVSFFLQNQIVPKYKAGEDFLTTEEEWKHIQAGKKPTREIAIEGTTKILTLRDAAAYVHGDHYLKPFLDAADYLIDQGVPHRSGHGIVESRNSIEGYFSCWGKPFIGSLLGAGLVRGCTLSFLNKWKHFVPRVAYSNYVNTGRLLSQAYPEGSPMHCSESAMHSLVGLLLSYMLLHLFDNDTLITETTTVGEELLLLGDNTGGWRFIPGVHREDDHEKIRPIAKALAKRILLEHGCSF